MYSDKIKVEFPNCDVCILGDFNQYSRCDFEVGLHIVLQPTRKNNILDKCLVSRKLLKVMKSDVRDSIGKSDHNALSIWKSYTKKSIHRYTTHYDLRESNLQNFYEALNKINGHSLYTRCSI